MEVSPGIERHLKEKYGLTVKVVPTSPTKRLEDEIHAMRLELIRADNDADKHYESFGRLRRILSALESQWWWRWLGAPVAARVIEENNERARLRNL